MPRTLFLDPSARDDIRRIASFISLRVSPGSAARWLTRIESILRRLETDAEAWPEAEEAVDLGLPLRCRVHGRRPHVYRILYTIDGPTVNVLRVRHAAQDAITADDL